MLYPKIQSIYKRDAKGAFTDEFSTPAIEYLSDRPWEWTEKVDGTNIRVIFDGVNVSLGGRTDNAQPPTPLIGRLGDRFGEATLEVLRRDFPDGVTLFGEGYGPKIQKGGGNYRSDQDFVLFDVRVGPWWLLRGDVEDVAGKLGLDVVPVVGRGTLFDVCDFVRDGVTSRWGDFQAEGVVARPCVELSDRAGNRVITKVKCRDFR